MSHTADDYTGELLVPGPETRVKLADLLERRARLSEELALVQKEIAGTTPRGFSRREECCGSTVIGYIAARLDPSSDESVWAVHTATLKHPDGCCSLDDTGARDEVERMAWEMAKVNGLIWPSETSS